MSIVGLSQWTNSVHSGPSLSQGSRGPIVGLGCPNAQLTNSVHSGPVLRFQGAIVAMVGILWTLCVHWDKLEAHYGLYGSIRTCWAHYGHY